ncbi:hypothetical protein [Stutzerimonas nitrititolerans]|uniref:hypothetical protein n=2 Tax=Stutzerimonas nitrititolerans TaxID=2482751 RepID=UPI001FD613D2|nr:hypothetical protein [Stutzerimonas nitrititolerans]
MWQDASGDWVVPGFRNGKTMVFTIKVMSRGRVIDSISSSVRMESDIAVVSYLGRLWPVVDGCIHLDDAPGVDDEDRREWALLVARLLPEPLPDQVDACSELIKTRFRGAIPGGIVQAICSLVTLRLEQQARAALVDFLTEKHDAARLRRLLRLQLLFMERTSDTPGSAIVAKPSPDLALFQYTAEAEVDWEWEPEAEPEVPDVDDDPLRNSAAQLQASIGAHRMQEFGEGIPGFDDVSEMPWAEGGLRLDDQMSGAAQEHKLVERTLKLGPMAIELLRYFADNPGDRSFHAEQVLGYPVSDINRLLTGSLSHHVIRSSSGGWECHRWVIDVLGALDASSS